MVNSHFRLLNRLTTDPNKVYTLALRRTLTSLLEYEPPKHCHRSTLLNIVCFVSELNFTVNIYTVTGAEHLIKYYLCIQRIQTKLYS